MSKKILIDGSNSDQTRIAVTEDDKLEDFEIESNKKNAVKGDVYLAKITRVEPSLQAAFVDFGTNRNGFLPLNEIHPDYFKIPSADQKEVQTLYKKLLEEDVDDDKVEKDQTKEENEEVENIEGSDDARNHKIKSRATNPRKDYINFFRKYKIQDVIRPRQVMLVQINKEESIKR